jgi:hypothetical protein
LNFLKTIAQSVTRVFGPFYLREPTPAYLSHVEGQFNI